jgi:hypothetical protein
MITEDELDTRLAREARSMSNVALSSATARSLVKEGQRAAKSASTMRRVVVGASASVVIVGSLAAAPAAAQVIREFLAQSDWTSDGTEVVDDSEFIDTSAPDLREYIEWTFPSQLPLAPSQSRESVIDAAFAQLSADPGLRQAVGIQRTIEHLVYVAWIDEWIDAKHSGDSARQDAAADVLGEAAAWPAFSATDGGGVTYVMARYAEEISHGNLDAAQELAQVEGAGSWDGVDRADKPGSLYSRFVRDYEDAE